MKSISVLNGITIHPKTILCFEHKTGSTVVYSGYVSSIFTNYRMEVFISMLCSDDFSKVEYLHNILDYYEVYKITVDGKEINLGTLFEIFNEDSD